MGIELFKSLKDAGRKAGSVGNYLRLIFLACTFFIAHDAQAQGKWDGKSPYWNAGVCGKLRFSAWDKFNMHPPYHIKYIVKHTIYTYTAEKTSNNEGEASYAIFPDDFIDGKGEVAYLSLPCVSDKISYEIYGDGNLIEAGEVGVNYKILPLTYDRKGVAIPPPAKMGYAIKVDPHQHSEQEAACFATVGIFVKNSNTHSPKFKFVRTDSKDDPLIKLIAGGRVYPMPCHVSIENHSVQFYIKGTHTLGEAYYTYKRSGNTYSVRYGH